MPARRLLLEWCAIALVAIGVTAGVVLTRGVSRFDNAVYDVLVSLRTPQPSDRIIIVAVDDASLAALGRWPLPRSLHAKAIEQIGAARPDVIVYDILFTEHAQDPTEDSPLAEALAASPVVLPLLLDAPGSNGRAFDIVPPIAQFLSAATAIGHVALPLDETGRARTVFLWMSDRATKLPQLAEVAYRAAEGRPSTAYSRAIRGGDPGMLIPFAPSGSFRQVPFEDVVAGRVPASFFANRMVLVGVAAGGLGDRHRVAGAGILSGVEVQANVLNAIIGDRFVRETPLYVRLAWGTIPSLMLLLLFWHLRPTAALLASLATIAAVAGLPVLLIFLGWWLPPASALLGLLIVYPLWGWRRLQAVDRAMSQELALFTNEDLPGRSARIASLDPSGRSAAQLSQSIAALRDLKRLISDTVDGVSDPLVVTGMQGEVLLANDHGERLLEEEWLGALLRDAAAGPAITNDVALPDGRTFSPRRTPLRDAQGIQRGWILLLAEITAIRDAERDREEALEFLSHDMRAPQTAIITLLEGTPENSLPKELASRLAHHARRTLGLADDFVQLARLREAAFDPAETDIGDALAEAMDAVWPQASAKDVRIVRLGAPEPCCVMGEHAALSRTLTNLVDNAVKFSPAGMEVRCTLNCSMHEGRPWAEVIVEDRGPGIAKERLGAPFERFGHVERQAGSASAGLGLAYVDAVASRYGGSVAYAPVSPSGSRFSLRLPALPNSSKACDQSAG